MKIKIVTNTPEIHTTPLSKIMISNKQSVIEFDDVHHNRWKLSFKTIMGWKVTTDDCFEFEPLLIDETLINGVFKRYMLEVADSEWVEDFKKIFESKNLDVTVLDKTHHYILLLDEDVIEVLAWDNYVLEMIV